MNRCYLRVVKLFGIIELTQLQKIVEYRKQPPLYNSSVVLADVACYLRPFCSYEWVELVN